jgi:hypothetical protein
MALKGIEAKRAAGVVRFSDFQKIVSGSFKKVLKEF